MRENIHSKINRHISLKALKVFEVCSRHGSFSSAAEELFVTQSAISKQIKKLEEDLGFLLFSRDAQTNVLSTEGRILSAHLINMFDDLNGVIDQLAYGLALQPLVISCEPTICLKLLIPLVPEILAQTGVEVRVLSGGGPIDFRREHVDLAIRRNDFTIDSRLHVKTLAPEYVGPVIAPGLKFCDGDIDESFVKIHASTRADAWLNWQEKENFEFRKDIYVDHHFLAIEAAESGQGVALMSAHMVARSIEQKRLMAPRGFREDGSKYLCLSPSPFELDERKVKFCDWLTSRLEKNVETVNQLS